MAGWFVPPPPNVLERFSAIYDNGLLNHTRAYQDMSETLEQAAATAQLAVLTNKMRGATMKILEGLDLARFFWQISGVDGPTHRNPRLTASKH